jgi:DNA polymerase III subunit epsilon
VTVSPNSKKKLEKKPFNLFCRTSVRTNERSHTVDGVTATIARAEIPLSKRKGQLTLDDLGAPLADVTFCVIDIETTGASYKTCGITEIAAAKFRGGACIGEFQTLINPGVEIPPMITFLTSITTAMVLPAPKVESVLESLREFVRDSVIVGHNVRFDLGFLNKALATNDWPTFTNRVVDTCGLARRLVREEVQNCKLGTLARHFDLPNQPTHRALDDVRATADLLHLLLERASGFGVLGIDDLLELPAINRHPQAHKLHLTNTLPRTPGVYLFRDVDGKVLYVGKASNLRTRVRSYFSSEDRRKVQPMLRLTHRIDHVPCTTPLEAAVLENRLIQREMPRFNRQAKMWTAYRYLRIIGSGANAKIAVTATPGGVAKAQYLGPFSSVHAARLASMALREAGDAFGPTWTECLQVRPEEVVETLAVNMRTLAEDERFEEAAMLRDRAGILARGIDRQRKAQALRSTGWLTLTVALPRLPGARLGATESGGVHEVRFVDGRIRFGEGKPDAIAHVDPHVPVPAHLIDELAVVVRWLETVGTKARIDHADRGLAFASVPMVRFDERSIGVTPAPRSNAAGASGIGQPSARPASSRETRIKDSNAASARPLSTASTAKGKARSRSSAKPATTQAAAAFNNTMSRWGPGVPSSTARKKRAFSSAAPPRN